MSDAAALSADRGLRMLEPMTECAYALGMAFGAAAKAEGDLTVQLQLFDAFHRSCQAVRLGIRLSMALHAPPRAAAPAPAERLDHEALEIERPDPIETERPETDRREVERDRDRDYEPLSLPRFLATLGMVASDAERLPAHATAEALPTLKGLLARAEAPALATRPSAAVHGLARPPAKATLLGSAAAPLLRPVGLRSPGRPRPPPVMPRAR